MCKKNAHNIFGGDRKNFASKARRKERERRTGQSNYAKPLEHNAYLQDFRSKQLRVFGRRQLPGVWQGGGVAGTPAS